MHLKIKDIFSAQAVSECGTVKGWVKSARHGKTDSFVTLSDGSCFTDFQLVCPATLKNFETEIKKSGTGCAISAKGKIVESQGKGQKYEMLVEHFELIGDVDNSYPLQKKRHTFEYLRDIAHLRMRTNTFGAVMRVRNAIARSIHNFFQNRGFIWLHSPIITASDCEGAGDMFQVSTLDLNNLPRNDIGEVDYTEDFFSQKAHLTVSGQLEGEIAALALSNIYTFGPTFRAENSNTSRHLSEFWMVEPEMAFCDLEMNMDIAEAFLKQIFTDVLVEVADDLEFFNKMIDKSTLAIMKQVISTPFSRITYSEAIKILQNAKKDFKYPVKWGIDLQSEHERFITEEYFKEPVIVSDYPKDIKAFYMKMNDDEKTVRAMDVLVPRVGEIIGGSERENNYKKLKNRIENLGLNPDNYWWYLDLRRYGSVPHSGFGLGFERIVQFITGMKNIRDVIPFPRTPGNAGF